MPTGETSNTYRISVSALANGHTAHFEVILHVGNDVTLQMSYTLNDGSRREIFCQNKQSRTADTVYDDELTEDILPYEISIVGSDADGVKITSVKCTQPGNRNKTKHLRASDTVPLFLNKGKPDRTILRSKQRTTREISIPSKSMFPTSIRERTA